MTPSFPTRRASDLHVESVYFGELAVTGYSRQLIRSSMAIDEVRNDIRFTKAGHKTRKTAGKIALVGEETRGPGIACLAAENGIRVRMKSRSEEDTSELQSLMRNSYAVFCLK